MPRVTQQDISEMRSRGYDAATIKCAEVDLIRTQDADRICSMISAAFADVKLGEGIGLWEAQGLDDYEDEQTCMKYRERDEKLNWKIITDEDLERCNSSPSFLDAEGFRFHLPAFMIADLRDAYGFDFIYSMINFQHLKYERYKLLSPLQRQAVREYLIWHRDDPQNDSDRPEIEKALSSYWTEESCQPQKIQTEQAGTGQQTQRYDSRPDH